MRIRKKSEDLRNPVTKAPELIRTIFNRVDTAVHKGRWIIYSLLAAGAACGVYSLWPERDGSKEVVFQTEAEKLIDGFIHERSDGVIEQRLSEQLSLLSPDQIIGMIENDIPKLKRGGALRLYLMLAGNPHMNGHIRILAAHNALKRQAQNFLPLDSNLATILSELCSDKHIIQDCISLLENALHDAEKTSHPDIFIKKSYENSLSILKQAP